MIARKLLFLLLAALAGAAGFFLGVPLAWVLGPLAATAALAMSGQHPFAPVMGRRFGQVLIGGAIGLNMTPDVLAGMIAWIPAMIASSAFAMLVGAAMARAFAATGGIDQKTAFYAMMPGGLSEMANLGARSGALAEVISMVQALRVALVVCILPGLIVSLGIEGDFAALRDLPVLGGGETLLLVAGSLAGVAVMLVVRFNNPWMIGALIGSALMAATGLLEGHMPRVLFYLGQFMIGIAIGARFRRELMVHMLRLSGIGIGFILAMTVVLLLYAPLLAWWGGIDIASAALSTAPGGFAEMSVTAETLHLDVALVAGFHLIRSLMVNGTVGLLWGLLHRVGWYSV